MVKSLEIIVDGNQIIVKLNNKSEIYTKYLADKTH
jgi:hypothetical protein